MDHTALDSIQFNQEIQGLMASAPESAASSFTALLELPPPQAVELLHSPECIPAGKPHSHVSNVKPYPLLSSFEGGSGSSSNLNFPSNNALIERAARYSVFAGEGPAAMEEVKDEPQETHSNPSSTQCGGDCVSDPAVENRGAKRKEPEKKVKASSKKSKSVAAGEKLPYVHVRVRRGQATDSHSLAERARREKINARMKLLQELVPGCNKISGTALVLDEIINHVQSLQRQVEFLSMKLAAVDPRIDFNLDSILANEGSSLMDSNFPSMVPPVTWTQIPNNGISEQYQQPWQFDAFHQPLFGKEEDNPTFMTPENSLLSYDSSANSVTLHSNQLKMEL